MVRPGFKRKLTAILHTDVQGYSRLMGDDEEATVRSLTLCMDLMHALIERYRGRVVSGAGDSLLAEFRSVVDAVSCAVEIQKGLTEIAEQTKDHPLVFRIGINLGDVIEQDGDLLGDGVNIAARVEALADGGGICITRSVYDQVKKKLRLGYEYLGEHEVKNISEPVRVYRIISGSLENSGIASRKKDEPRRWLTGLAIAFVLLLVTGTSAFWFFRYPSPKLPLKDNIVSKMVLPLPDKPSLAVLPFVNMSDDPSQEYFSDGITEDLITDLSKISGLFIIARNSTFTYKGRSVKVQQVAEDLGVRYVLEGSVRKAGEKIRINAQLVDALSGHHLWADRFDGQHSDIFVLQDKFTQKIVEALAITLTKDDQSLLARKETASVEAHDAYLQGWEFMRRENPDDLVKAVASFKKAVKLDPEFSRGHTALSLAYNHAMTTGWDVELGWFDAASQAQNYLALASKKPTPQVHREAAAKHLYKREFQKAINEAKLALALGPNDPESHWAMGRALVFSGQSAEGAKYLHRAVRLNPSYPGRYALYLGIAKYLQKRYEEALVLLEKAEKLEPSEASVAFSNSWYAATYAQLGREDDAVAVMEKNLKIRKFIYGGTLQSFFPFWPLKDPLDIEHYADGLIKAGMPVPWNPAYRGKYEEAFAKAKKLLGADPDNPANHIMMAEVLTLSGRPEEAINLLQEEMKGKRKPKYAFFYQLGIAQFSAERFADAIDNLEHYHLINPYGARMWFLAAAYAHVGRVEKAKETLNRSMAMREYVEYTVEKVVRYENFRFKNGKDVERFVTGLRKAGLAVK